MQIQVQALFASFIRTFVPIIVGGALSLLASLSIVPDADLADNLTLVLTTGFTILSQILYYAVVRLFERYVNPKIGWLLGSSSQPVYAKPDDTGALVITDVPATTSTAEVTVKRS